MSDSLQDSPTVIYIVARSRVEVNGEVYRNAPLGKLSGGCAPWLTR